MRYRPVETLVLVISVLKWVVIAACVGVIVGLLSSLFLVCLDSGIALVSGFPRYYWLLPLAMLACPLLVNKLCPEARGHGTEKVIEALHKKRGEIRPAVIPTKFLATILTIVFGGSAGKEGPAAQMGAGAAAIFAKALRFGEDERKKIVICGISASFAAVFGTPLGGAIFGVEVLFVGRIMYGVLLPSVVSGIVAHQVTAWLGVPHINYLHVSEHPRIVEGVVQAELFGWTLGAGIFFGLCAILFVEMLDGGERLAKASKLPSYAKGALAGLAMVGLSLLFSTDYLGLGTSTINAALNGVSVVWYAFLLKMLFTVATLSFGGSGGLVTPLFFIGATAGLTFASLFNLDPQIFAALGLVAVLAGATNTPLACTIIGIEMLGREMAPYTATVCVIAFLITGYRSVYPSQVLAIIKSSSLAADLGREMHQLMPAYSPRRKSLTTTLLIRLRAWRRRRRRRRRP